MLSYVYLFWFFSSTGPFVVISFTHVLYKLSLRKDPARLCWCSLSHAVLHTEMTGKKEGRKDERWEETGREIRKKGGGEKQPASCIDKRPFEISLEKLLGVRC